MVPSRIRVLMVGVRNMNGSVEWTCPWRSKGRALTLWAESAGHPSAAKPTLDSSLGRTAGAVFHNLPRGPKASPPGAATVLQSLCASSSRLRRQ